MSNDFEQDDRNESIRPTRSSPIRPNGTSGPPRARPRDGAYDEAPPASGGGGGALKVILIILCVVGLLGVCIIGACGVGGYLLFSRTRQSVVNASNRLQEINNYKQIALALHNYHEKYGSFPPVQMKTKDGSPGLSWRVAILPFLGQEPLYRQFKLDEKWDSPTNKSLASRMPKVYAPVEGGTAPDKTHVRVFVGQMPVFNFWQSRRLIDITDGTANTFLLVESTDPVTWTEPTELTYNPKGQMASLGMPNHDYFIAAMADGMVRMVKKSTSQQKINAAITAAGGELDFLDP